MDKTIFISVASIPILKHLKQISAFVQYKLYAQNAKTVNHNSGLHHYLEKARKIFKVMFSSNEHQ